MQRQMRFFAPLLAAMLAVACAAGPADNPTATATLDPTATASQLAGVTATKQAAATEIPISSVCSPLEGNDLSILSHIIGGNPFISPPSPSQWDAGHHGVDFAYYHGGSTGGNIDGTPIQSALDGNVAGEGYAEIYGNYLIIETPFARLEADLAALYLMQDGQSLYLLYAHMREMPPFVLSEPIDCGQVVGLVGMSGGSEHIVQAHLHFETRVGPSAIRLDPMNYYTTSASEEENKEYEFWRNNDTFKIYDPMILFNYAVQNQ